MSEDVTFKGKKQKLFEGYIYHFKKIGFSVKIFGSWDVLLEFLKFKFFL